MQGQEELLTKIVNEDDDDLNTDEDWEEEEGNTEEGDAEEGDDDWGDIEEGDLEEDINDFEEDFDYEVEE